jgi:hypothetical protein
MTSTITTMTTAAIPIFDNGVPIEWDEHGALLWWRPVEPPREATGGRNPKPHHRETPAETVGHTRQEASPMRLPALPGWHCVDAPHAFSGRAPTGGARAAAER